ncbi:hypothetical protein SUGI_1115710 [Cryptomeria japonica]|nr:hypothetical protein SUGI_1115710 [Cryptomeria japonica]
MSPNKIPKALENGQLSPSLPCRVNPPKVLRLEKSANTKCKIFIFASSPPTHARKDRRSSGSGFFFPGFIASASLRRKRHRNCSSFSL